MKLNDLINQTGEWLRGKCSNPGIVVSSRIRLARNLQDVSFPHWATKEQKKEVLNLSLAAVKTLNCMKNAIFLDLNELTQLDKQFLAERHLISREFARASNSNAVIISEKEIIAIMVNEEDHLRIQVIQSGLDLFGAYRLINDIDEKLAKRLKFAYSDNLGYLTACPTNVGTGMRASIMLHLPALVMDGEINKILREISRFNLTARGLYGEGTQASGDFFQISNQATLGRSEEDIVDNMERIVKQVVEYEGNCRSRMLSRKRLKLEDKIWRSFGTLERTHLISSEESTKLLSFVRLGVALELIKQLSFQLLNQLFILTQPAHLQKIEGRELTAEERDLKRAELIRRKLKEGDKDV